MRGDQELASLCELPQKPIANPGSLLLIVLEAVEPVRVVEPDRENGVAGE